MTQVSLELAGSAQADASLRELYHWLRKQPDLQGTIGQRHRPAERGTLGPGVLEALVAVLSSAGALTALSSCVISWIRHRTHDLSITAKNQNGAEVTIDAQRVRAASQQQLAQLVQEVVAALSDESPPRVERTDGQPPLSS